MRTVPSPRPDAPPVTMNVLPLICIWTSLGLLRGFLLLRQELRAVAQQRIDRRVDFERGGEAVEGLRLYRHRVIESGIGLRGIGDDVDEVHPAERARQV